MKGESSVKKEGQVFIWIIIASILVSSISFFASNSDYLGIIFLLGIIFSALILPVFATIYFSRYKFMKGVGSGLLVFLLHWVYIWFWMYLFPQSEVGYLAFSFFYFALPMSFFIVVIAGITRFISKKRGN